MSIKWEKLPPQIYKDKFYHDIITVLQQADNIKSIIEIGASSGEGSTEALMFGRGTRTDIKVYTIEVARERFEGLESRYRNEENFFPYNVSSVPISQFAVRSEVELFLLENPRSPLVAYHIDTICEWLRKDLEYVSVNDIFQEGIQKIKNDSNIDVFDCVLIDGSEFTGKPELDLLYGAKYVMLDDTMTFKNNFNRKRLMKDPSYKLLIDEPFLRHGYSIFKRIA
jgi:hypothetical protein